MICLIQAFWNFLSSRHMFAYGRKGLRLEKMDKREFYGKKEWHRERADEDILGRIQRKIHASDSRSGVYKQTVMAAEEELKPNVCINDR